MFTTSNALPIESEVNNVDESQLQTQPVIDLKVTKLEEAIDYVTSQVLADVANDTTSWSVQLPDQHPIFITNFTLENDLDNTTLSKRWNSHNAPLGASWTQHQVARQGQWWGPWYPKSCAIGNSKSERDSTWRVKTESSYSQTISAGFDMGAANSASMGTFGVSVTKTNSQSHEHEYIIPAGGWGQVWTRQLMIWQDQQHQKCHKYNYGSKGIHCGAWSEYIHGDVPAKNNAVFTWSTGYENMDFNSCGGGTSWSV